MRPDPGPFDADWSATRTAVENLGPWRAIWDTRREPDAFARRCAADAIDAIDTALAALHRIRAEWVSEIRQADDQSAARADELLARMRDGPRHAATGDRHQCRPAARSDAEAMPFHGTARRRQGGDP